MMEDKAASRAGAVKVSAFLSSTNSALVELGREQINLVETLTEVTRKFVQEGSSPRISVTCCPGSRGKRMIIL